MLIHFTLLIAQSTITIHSSRQKFPQKEDNHKTLIKI